MSNYFKISGNKVRKPKEIVYVEDGLYADRSVSMYKPSNEEFKELKAQGNILLVLKNSKKKEPASAFPIHITQLFKQRTIRLIANKEKAKGLVDAQTKNIEPEKQTQIILEHYRQNPKETIQDIELLLKAYYEPVPNQHSADISPRHQSVD